ncbi:MAG: peptidoglycan-binding domain-containing protein [Candidatus Melainabacteria bacterium]
MAEYLNTFWNGKTLTGKPPKMRTEDLVNLVKNTTANKSRAVKIADTEIKAGSNSDKYTPVVIQKIASKENILKQGSQEADDIRDMQTWLQAQGFYNGNIDGDFGSKTLKAVKKFQISRGITADGVVGGKTWQALSEQRVRTDILAAWHNTYTPSDKGMTNEILNDEVVSSSETSKPTASPTATTSTSPNKNNGSSDTGGGSF